MRNTISITILLILLLCLSACEKEVEWVNDNEASTALVVECILTNEYKYQMVKLSHPKLNVSDAASCVSGALVKINDGMQDLIFVENDSLQGTYYSPIKFAASVSKTYNLSLTWEEQTHYATTKMEAIKPMSLFSYTATEFPNFYNIPQGSSNYSASEQALYIIDVYSDSVITEVDTTQSAKLFYYVFSTLDVGEVFAPSRGECRFYKGAKIFQKKYALTDDYAEFVRAMASETEWQGSFFSEESANLPCNIEGENVLGYFTACTILMDSLVVN